MRKLPLFTRTCSGIEAQRKEVKRTIIVNESNLFMEAASGTDSLLKYTNPRDRDDFVFATSISVERTVKPLLRI